MKKTKIGKNIIDFKEGDFIKSVYTKKVYKVLKIKSGMAKLKQVGAMSAAFSDWNSYNNPHFESAKDFQLQLF